MPAETFTAPLAIIKINNQSVGKIRNLSFTENLQRGEVMGLGEVTLQEAPVTSIRCQFQAGSYMLNLKKLGTVKDPFWPVDALDAKTLLNTIILGETPVSIHVYKKTAGAVDANGIVTSEGPMERIGIISDCYVNSRSWEISEGNLGGKNISGIYFTPIFLV
jgi:hypothetical protein